ncbi:unnamed protein product [Rotaria sp. Silwood1]|nr:unnamed protein product [Rotaria sp. Silwood1]CAF3398816.1 unnamed protein product [Rotaria sp. Silwood1]CAF4697890.1 unnamed protein product [Rotaria sp. Silwood1]CAF4779928.1 unnamed protein product [Rotaria sp. Silwood1]
MKLQIKHYSSSWASLDCLLTSLPITPLSRSSIIMRSNGTLPMTDSRRISPQTTSSSGYHSDLSSATPANQSPQSIHDILPVTLEKSCISSSSSSSSQLQKKTISAINNSTYDKLLINKNLSRISSFIRKQYERAKSKFISKPLLSSSQIHVPKTTTCSKATSTTPITHLLEDNSILTNKQDYSICNKKPYYHQNNLSSVYQQSSFTEPVYSIDVYPSHNHQVKLTASHQHKNYTSIHDCYSHQPSYGYSTKNNSHQYSSSYRRLAAMANFEYNNYNIHRHHYYPYETLSSLSSQNYYPYQYTNNNYDYNRSNYVPLSDFISTKNSAFKPIGQKQKQFYSRPSYNMFEQVPPSDDPCDLEVAQYFPQTSQWSNPNYFDIYSKEINVPKQNYTETLC